MRIRPFSGRRRPRLVLHAGIHKTGTTSIQRMLKDSRDADRARGLFYPYPEKLTRAMPHHRFAHGLASATATYASFSPRFVEYTQEQVRDGDLVVISSEPIYRHAWEMDWSRTTWHDDAAYWAARRRYLQNVARALKEFDVSVLLFLREKESFVASMAAERTNTGDWAGSGDDLAEQYPQLIEFDRQVELFNELVGPVTTVDYELALQEGGSVVAFYRAIGFEPPPGATSMRVRVTEPDPET
ncbi:MAG: hypothetical protein ACRDOT_05320 [Aeromicrobium sp.]